MGHVSADFLTETGIFSGEFSFLSPLLGKDALIDEGELVALEVDLLFDALDRLVYLSVIEIYPQNISLTKLSLLKLPYQYLLHLTHAKNRCQ